MSTIEDITYPDQKDFIPTEPVKLPLSKKKLQNRKLFPCAITKDVDKEIDPTSYECGDYHNVCVAESDCSMDGEIQAYERLKRNELYEKSLKHIASDFAAEQGETHENITELGCKSIQHMQIMNTWSDDSYTSNLNQGATPTYNLGDQFDEFCAMAFIAGPPDGADKEENRIRYNLLNDRNKERESLLKANLAAKDPTNAENHSKIANIRAAAEIYTDDSLDNLRDLETSGLNLTTYPESPDTIFNRIDDSERFHPGLDETSYARDMLKDIHTRVHGLGRIRKLVTRTTNQENIIQQLLAENGENNHLNFVSDVPTHTNIFGDRPHIDMLVHDRPCRMLFDSGANCSAFSKSFLDKVAKDLGKPLKLGPTVDIEGYADAVQESTTMLTIGNKYIPGTTEVPAIVADRELSSDFEGILGTNLMSSFHMGLEFPREGGILITYYAPDGDVKELESTIRLDDDEDPIQIHETFLKVRRATKYEDNVVILDEQMNIVPGKSMTVHARVMNMDAKLKSVANRRMGMIFRPNAGFEYLQEATVRASSVFEVKANDIGRLSNNNSTEDRFFAPGGPLYHNVKGREDEQLCKLYEKGHIIGKVSPMEGDNQDYKNFHQGKSIRQVNQEGIFLEQAVERDCICEILNYAIDKTIVFFGDKHGFNFQKRLQVTKPKQDFESLPKDVHFRQKDHIIALRKHGDLDQYNIERDKLQFKSNVYACFASRDDVTAGQLAAMQEIQNIIGKQGRVQIITQKSTNCHRCATLASEDAVPHQETDLLSGTSEVHIYYSIGGSKTIDPASTQRDAKILERTYSIGQVAKLQVFKAYGALRILVHMYYVESTQNKINNMIFVQGYLMNQFRIMRIPKNVSIYGSWKLLPKTRTPLNRVVSCMRTCTTWFDDEGRYNGVRTSGRVVNISRFYENCSCLTCKNFKAASRQVKTHEWTRLFCGDPREPSKGSQVNLDLPNKYKDRDNQAERTAEAFLHVHSILSHRSIMIQYLEKEHTAHIYKAYAKAKDPNNKSAKNWMANNYFDKQLTDERVKLVVKQMKAEEGVAAQIEDQAAPLEATNIISKKNKTLAKKKSHPIPRDTSSVSLDWPEAELDAAAAASKPGTEIVEGGTTEIEDVPKDSIQLPGRYQPPHEKLMQQLEKIEDDHGSTSTDDHMEDYIHKDAVNLDAADILGEKHREDEHWEPYFDKEKFPKDPKMKEKLIGILDKHNTTLSKRANSWRLMTIPEVNIKFNPDAEPIIHKHRQMTQVDDYVLTKKIDELIANELLIVVYPDQNTVRNITRLFLVKHNAAAGAKMVMEDIDKSDLDQIDISLYRCVADFRQVNLTIYNAGYADYVMGTPQEIVSRMGEYTHFVSLDLKSAYRSVPISKETARKLTVRADCNLYKHVLFEFKSLIDGVAIAPQLFTQIILEALHPYLDRVVIWIDDITILEKSAEKALDLMDDVLTALGKINALVALNKMQINIDFDEDTGAGKDAVFGHMGFNIKLTVRKDTVKGKYVCEPKLCISEVKKQLFGAMECPTTVKEVQIRLGCANWLLDFLPYHTVNMAPFIEKLCKGQETSWKVTPEMDKAWKKLIHALRNAEDLSIINYLHTLYIESDASLFGMGACMSQNAIRNGKKEKSILAYYSKRFKLEYGAHNKYTSVFRELLGLCYATDHWKRYIQSCARTCLTVDIASIVHMAASRHINDDAHLSRLIGRILLLGTVFKLRHRPAKYLPIPDALSRIDMVKDCNGDMVTATTGIPLKHLLITKEFLSTVPDRIPESWITEEVEIEMRDMVNHLCEQIARNDSLSARSAASRSKCLLESLHEKYRPIVEQWNLGHGAPDITTAKVNTMTKVDGAGRKRRVAFRKLPSKTQAQLDKHDKANKAKNQKYRIPYEDYELDTLLSMRGSDEAFYCRLQDMNPYVRQLKFEIMTKPTEQLDQKHKDFRLENNQLLVTRKDKNAPFTSNNTRIYLGSQEALYVLFYLHLQQGHRGINGIYSWFRSYFDTGYAKQLCEVVTKSCGPCRIYNPIRAKQINPGRLPRRLYAGEEAFIDVAHIHLGFVPDLKPTDKRILDHKKLVEKILIIQDSYSGRTAICPMLTQKTADVVDAIRMYQATNIPIQQIHCDNAPDFHTPEFYKALKPYGITGVTFSMPNTSTANSRVERFIRTLRELSFKMSQFQRTTSLWNVIYEANGLLNQRPCRELEKFLPADYKIAPSRNDLYFGLKPRNLEIHLEAALDQIPDLQDRLRNRKIFEEKMDEYNQAMNEILEKSNAEMPLNHKITVGDLVLRKDPRRGQGIHRGIPAHEFMVYKVLSIEHNKVHLQPFWGKNKTKEYQNLSKLVKSAAPHCLALMPDDVRESYGSPFTHAAMLQMKEKPTQYTNYLLKQRVDKAKTRAAKKQLTHRLKSKQPMTGNQLIDKHREADDEEEEINSIASDLIYNIDKWAQNDYPTELNEKYGDPRMENKGKALGDDLQVLEEYHEDNMNANSKVQANFEFLRHKLGPDSNKISNTANKEVAESKEDSMITNNTRTISVPDTTQKSETTAPPEPTTTTSPASKTNPRPRVTFRPRVRRRVVEVGSQGSSLKDDSIDLNLKERGSLHQQVERHKRKKKKPAPMPGMLVNERPIRNKTVPVRYQAGV